MKKNRELLIIEDNPADYAHYLRLLDSSKHIFTDFYYVNGVENALLHLDSVTPACCIMDYSLPDGNAKDLLQRIKLKFGELQFPIVVITGQSNELIAKELIQLGIQNYLLKSDLNEAVLSNALNDTVSRFAKKAEINFKSNHDQLTGLINSLSFDKHIEEAVEQFRKFQIQSCLLRIQITNLTDINDQFGEDIGDEVIKLISRNITQNLSKGDIVARLHGNEFSTLLNTCESHIGHYTSQKFTSLLSKTQNIEGNSVTPKLAIGMSVTNATTHRSADLLRQANIAVKQAITDNLNYKKYLPEVDLAREHKEIEQGKIKTLIKNGDFSIDYRPVFCVNQEAIESIEMLPNFGKHSKSFNEKEIFSICNHADIMSEYYKNFVPLALAKLLEIQKAFPQLKCAINLSAKALNNHSITNTIITQAGKFGLTPSDIIIDIAEQQLAQSMHDIKMSVDSLASGGVNVAVDQYGTGFSSIEYIGSLNCQQLKIDRRLLAPRTDGVSRETLIAAICSLGHTLGLHVIAEGVADDETYRLVERCGCDAIQGYHLNDMDQFHQGASRTPTAESR